MFIKNLKKIVKILLKTKKVDRSFSKDTHHFTYIDVKKSKFAKKFKIDNSIPDDMEIRHNIDYTNRMFTALMTDLLLYFDKSWSDITITSWWRSKKLNKKLEKLNNASKTSDHMKGKAIDFYIKGLDPQEICEFIHNKFYAFDQLIMYKNFVHISFESNVILERNENLIKIDKGYKKVNSFS
jgi:uncharacterized protein YcbK (DUF882 family)